MNNHRTRESAGGVSWAMQVIEYKMQVAKLFWEGAVHMAVIM